MIRCKKIELFALDMEYNSILKKLLADVSLKYEISLEANEFLKKITGSRAEINKEFLNKDKKKISYQRLLSDVGDSSRINSKQHAKVIKSIKVLKLWSNLKESRMVQTSKFC